MTTRLNRQQRRRAGRVRLPAMPPMDQPSMDSQAPAMSQKMTAALFVALRGTCECEACQILRGAADDLIDLALGESLVLEEEDAGVGG